MVRVQVDSAEIATLKDDGRPWDGPGGPRLRRDELAGFFALDITRQLDRLVQTGEPPTPPDVFVRITAGGRVILETRDEKSFDPEWHADPDAVGEVEVAPGDRLRIQVWDRDVLFNDLIGETEFVVPEGVSLALGGDGTVRVGPFGQVRSLVLRLA